MRRTAIAATVLLVFATAASAPRPSQSDLGLEPSPFPIGECTTLDEESDTPAMGDDLQNREEFQIPSGFFFPGNLCTAYTWPGWEETMLLHLGEGAEEYRDLIDLAVKVWNETVNLPSREPLIEIVETEPMNYRLPESFSSEPDEVALDNREDGESVIYFKPYDGSSWGVAWVRGSYADRKMVEADVYINTGKRATRATP